MGEFMTGGRKGYGWGELLVWWVGWAAGQGVC